MLDTLVCQCRHWGFIFFRSSLQAFTIGGRKRNQHGLAGSSFNRFRYHVHFATKRTTKFASSPPTTVEVKEGSSCRQTVAAFRLLANALAFNLGKLYQRLLVW